MYLASLDIFFDFILNNKTKLEIMFYEKLSTFIKIVVVNYLQLMKNSQPMTLTMV